MAWPDLGFSKTLERPVPATSERAEADTEMINPSRFNTDLVASRDGSLQIDLLNNKITKSDGRRIRQLQPPVDLIVALDGTGDFGDLQEAIEYAKQIGGATIFIKSGTYRPRTFLTLYDNIHLIGQDPETVIIDFSAVLLNSNQAAVFAGGEELTNSGAISVSNNSTVVTGTANFANAGVQEDDVVYINAHPYRVNSVSSSSLILKETYRGISVSADIYAILRPRKNITLQNFTLLSNRGGTNNGGLLFTWCEKLKVDKVKVRSFSGHGFTVESCFNFSFYDCEAHNNNTGFEVHDESAGDRVTNGAFVNCYSWGNSNRGFNLDGVSIVRTISCTANGNNLGIRIKGDEIVVSDCHSEFNVLDGIRIDTSIYNRVIGNNCSSNANGIVLTGANQNNTVVGNICELNASDGVNIGGSSEGNTLTGNQLVANENYGLLIQSGGTDTIATGNYIAGNTVGAISDSGTNSIIRNNGLETIAATNTISDATVTATAEGSAETIASLTFTAPIASKYRIRLWVRHENSDIQRNFIKIQDGSTNLNEGVSGNTQQMVLELVVSTATVGESQFMEYISTELSAGSHTLNVKCWVSGITGTINLLYLEVEALQS